MPVSDVAAGNVENTIARCAIVFDDHLEIAELATRRLEHLGFEVEIVADKAAFVASVDSRHPDLILLDLSLGDTDAIAMFAVLQERNYRGPVILMSGHSGTVLDHACRVGKESGIAIAGILKKPFHQRDLRALISGVVDVTPKMPSGQPSGAAVPDLLRRALANDALEFWYQPKIDLRTNQVVGVESLARIRSGEGRILPPAAFLKDASVEDLDQLTLRALAAAYCSAEALLKTGRRLSFSINVAASTFVRETLLDDLMALRKAHSRQIPVTLEVTETELLDDKELARSFATRAILHGFEVSIDDFGHGYATFDRLRAMPFSELKLERAVVDGCARDPALRSICKAALQLARGFGAKAVAEGVENVEDLAVIRSLGFDVAQGYYFSKPVPLSEFERLPAAYPADTRDIDRIASKHHLLQNIGRRA